VQVTGIRGRQVFQVNLKVAQRPQNR